MLQCLEICLAGEVNNLYIFKESLENIEIIASYDKISEY